jgi:hypothetical protein
MGGIQEYGSMGEKLKYRLIGAERFSYLQIISFTLYKLNERNRHRVTRMNISKGV